MGEQFLEYIVNNGDTKILIILIAYFLKSLSTKIEKLSENVAIGNKEIALILQNSDVSDRRLEKNEVEILSLRERYHDLVNTHIVKIQLNEHNIREIKSQLET